MNGKVTLSGPRIPRYFFRERPGKGLFLGKALTEKESQQDFKIQHFKYSQTLYWYHKDSEIN